MKKDILHMTEEERWERAGELLYKGLCLLELERQEKEGLKPELPKEIYSLKEAAEYLGISHRTMQRRVADRQIPIQRRKNGYIYIKGDNLRSYKYLRKKTSAQTCATTPN